MKTPQQIRNEVEKEGLEIMERLQDDIKEGRSFLVDEKDYPSYLNVVDNEVNLAKSKILTEYDKSIKEMIEELIFHKSRPDSYNQNIKIINVSDIKELLSKIGDVQQSKEKREGLYLSDEQFQKEIMFAKEQTSEEKEDENS